MKKRKSRERDGEASRQPLVLRDQDVQPTVWPRSEPPPIGCRLNDEGTQRILDEVGSQFVPQGLELEALRDDLYGCYVMWCALTQLGSPSIAKRRFKRLEKIAKDADALLALLRDDNVIGGWARQEVGMTFPLKEGTPVGKTAEFRTDHGKPDPAPSFNGFLAGLERLAAAGRHKAAYFSDRPLYERPRSPLDLLVAVLLPTVFERHFGSAAGRSRNPLSKKAGGPYIRFALATLRELGITKNGKPYAPDTIARALSGVRAGRVRRRKND